jgi:hypothetical protein
MAGQKREARLHTIVPAIHVFFSFLLDEKEDVDARHKAGHDGKCLKGDPP